MENDGYFNTIQCDNQHSIKFDVCPAWNSIVERPGIAAAIRKKWRAARQNDLSDAKLEAFVDNFVAEHGDMARKTFDLFTDGGGRVRYSIMYNTFLADVFVERNPHSYPGGYTIKVPRTYEAHVADLKQYTLARARWLDAHIDNFKIKPLTGKVRPVFVVAVTAVALYLAAIAVVGYKRVTKKNAHTIVF